MGVGGWQEGLGAGARVGQEVEGELLEEGGVLSGGGAASTEGKARPKGFARVQPAWGGGGAQFLPHVRRGLFSPRAAGDCPGPALNPRRGGGTPREAAPHTHTHTQCCAQRWAAPTPRTPLRIVAWGRWEWGGTPAGDCLPPPQTAARWTGGSPRSPPSSLAWSWGPGDEPSSSATGGSLCHPTVGSPLHVLTIVHSSSQKITTWPIFCPAK